MDAPRPLAVAEAQARILARFRCCDAEPVALAAALGRTLAADIVAARDLPSFTNSAMDGYAVRAIDTTGASASNQSPCRDRHARRWCCRIADYPRGRRGRDYHGRAAARRSGCRRTARRGGWWRGVRGDSRRGCTGHACPAAG